MFTTILVVSDGGGDAISFLKYHLLHPVLELYRLMQLVCLFKLVVIVLAPLLILPHTKRL